MPVLTEGQHPGEWLVSQANGTRSREEATVAQGQKLVDGQLVQLSGGKLVAKAVTLTTEGDFATAIEGIVIGDQDASATGTNADIKHVAYIKRDAEVKQDLLTFPAGTPQLAQAIVELEAMGIIVR